MSVSEQVEGSLPTVPTLPPMMQLIGRLEDAWQAVPEGQPPPDLSVFLPPPGDFLRPAALLELIRYDLDMRWRKRLPTLLESYYRQFPELGETVSLPVDLIHHEYRVRSRYGDQPILADYEKRFPAQFCRLLELTKGEAGSPAIATPVPEPAAVSVVGELQTSLPEAAPAPPDTAKRGAAPFSPPTLPPGNDRTVVPLVGGYRMLKRLGSGALGEVWKAEAPGGVEVAIKRLSRTLEAHEAQYELQSLEHVKRLRHTYLMPIHAFWVHEDRLHVAMELADGCLLDRAEQYRKKGLPGIPQDELLRCIREAAEALDFLHAEGIHHRDIKPANILLLKGHVKVADFGLVRPLRDLESVVNATFCGTPNYMAPEVWENKISAHSDQWSLAVSYLELRLNRRVFQGRSIASLMLEICNGKLDLKPLDDAEQCVLRKALHHNPRERYPACATFAEALEAVFQPAAPPSPRRRRLEAVLAVAACLIAVGLLVAFFLRPSPPSSPRIISQAQAPEEHVVSTGDSISFPLRFLRRNCNQAIQFRSREQLPGVTIEAEAAEGEDFATVRVRVEPGAKPCLCREVHLLTTDANLEGDFEFGLTILYLPAQFQPVTEETVEDDGRIKYFRRILHPFNGKSPIEFVLVPRKKAEWREDTETDEPPTFYISRYKITREQFLWFAEQNPKVVKDFRWKGQADDAPALPFRNVTVRDADSFARSLGGHLPLRVQWDKAAGYYHPSRRTQEGPYRGRWNKVAQLRIAVGDLTKPLVTGSAETQDDESVYGCRDMAGNGAEWMGETRGGKKVPLKNPVEEGDLNEYVFVRGWSFKYDKPLSFEEMYRERKQGFERSFPYKGAYDDVGFRVVLEPEAHR